MARVRYTLSNMPWRAGLTTAGQQSTIAEDQMWQAKNAMSGLDGLLTKRPGLWQWGQVLRYPVGTDDVTFYDTFADLSLWSIDEVTTNITSQASNNKLVVSVVPESSGTATNIYGRITESTQADSDDADWSLRFVVLASNMTSDGEFIVSAKAQTALDPYAFKITGDAVEYYATGGTWTTLYAYNFADAPATTFEFRFDANGLVTLLVDEVSVATQAVSGMDAYSAFTKGTYLELYFKSDSTISAQYTLTITDLMFDGTATNAFTADRLGAGTDFKTVRGGVAVQRNLLVAGTKHVYRDDNLKKTWSPLLSLIGGNVTFSQFGDELLIFDADDAFSSNVYRWSGSGTPEQLTDAPNVRFGTEHRTRIFAAGDKAFPLRLYFTASRQPNVWFAPESDEDGQEEFNEVLEAGYLKMPGKRGDEIVAVYGEFYGSVIVATNRGIWRVTGSSPQAYTVENVTQDTGASSQAGIARLANDLWLAGRQGITTVQTVQQFGDMKSQMPSATIADLWSPGISNSSIKVDQHQLYRNSMAWNPTLGLMYFAFARTGASDVSSIYVFNTATGAWYGPWEGDTTFVASVEIASPVLQTIMHGTSIGKVGISDVNFRADFDTAYTMTVESPYLSGRSLDPILTHQIKTWKSLRAFVQLSGAWDLSLRWQCDDETYETRVESQNIFNLPRLSYDWRLGVDPDGRIHSNQLIGVIEVPLDTRGRYFKFDVSTVDDIVGENFKFQGYEVEFIADGPDQEQE